MMDRKRIWLVTAIIGSVFLGLAPLYAQDNIEDGQPPTSVVGIYQSSYYANFSDWEVFPVLLPMTNADPRLPYEDRFDLTQAGQIVGSLRGGVDEGAYRIDLPTEPINSAWFDTDGDPNTPSTIKLFVVGTGSGMIGKNYVSRYDFIYTRSFNFDPNTHLWEGSLLLWSAENNSTVPILNGTDHAYYTADDVSVTVPAGWSIVEVKAKPAIGTQSIRIFHTSQPFIPLSEPRHLVDVDLTDLDYETAFIRLTEELERTYVFTDYRRVNWEQIRAQYAPKAAQVRNEREYHQLLENALFSFRDGHLTIISRGIPEWMWGRLGMQVYPVDGQLMVVQVYDHSPVHDYSTITPGTIITRVNGQDAMYYFETVPRSIYSGGHESEDLWLRGGLAFRGVPGTPYEITYRQVDGTENTVILRTVPLSEISNDPSPTDNIPIYYEIMDSGIGLIGIQNFTSARLDDIWDSAMQMMVDQAVPGIIIDLRTNGGGFSTISNYMLGDFLDEDIYSGREVSSVDKDGDGIPDVKEEYYFGRDRVFDPHRVMVLVGPNCFSACEFAAQGFQDIGAMVIGYLPSGGAGGGVGASYFLPGNTRIYGMAVVRSEDPNGNIMIEGKGVALDLQIPFTAEGLASGEDVILKAAEALLLEQ